MNVFLLTLLLCCISGLGAVPLLMSWTSSVRLFEETDTLNLTSLASTSIAVPVDYHYNRGEFYYSDTRKIYRGWLRPTYSFQKPIVVAEVKLSDGIAVDWINDNLYWTDVTAKKVEMSTLDGLYRKTLFDSSHGVEKPRAIVLDPAKGLLFWSDWGNNARIETSGLDGNTKQTIVTSNLVWPNGLTLDLVSEKVYILDGFVSSLSYCNYDGSMFKAVKRSQGFMQQAFGLTFYMDNLYWNSWRLYAVFSMHVTSGSTKIVYRHTGVSRIKERLMGIKAVHPDLQKSTSARNPCDTAGCSHKCLVGRGLTTTCICPFGFTLDSNSKTCVEEGYLLMSWRKQIHRHTLEGSSEEILLNNTTAIAIDYHLKKSLIFWSDIDDHKIYRAPLGQLNNKTVTVVAEHCDGLAVDWVHDVIYWTDTHHNTLEVAELDGTKRTLIFSENLEEPRAIVLDPHSRYIFWSDWGANPQIERAFLDGSDRKAIITYDVIWPNGITLDLEQKNMYWVDGKKSSISTCDYNGSKRRVLHTSQVVFLHPFSITLHQDKIYWVDWGSQTLFKANKNNLSEITRLANSTLVRLRPNGVKVVHSSLQKDGENPCASINCQDICLGSDMLHKGHCMGQVMEDPEIDIRIGDLTPEVTTVYSTTTPSRAGSSEEIPQANSASPELTSKANNDSIQLILSGTEIPSLAVVTVKCIKREGCAEDKLCSGGGDKVHVFTNQNTFDVAGLLPASHYDVDFKSSEYNEKIQIVTTKSDTPELPKINKVDVHYNTVTIKWDPVDTCVPGFRYYEYKLLKSGASQDVVLEGSTNLTEVSFKNLQREVNFTSHIYTYDPKYFSSTSFSVNEDAEEDVPPCKQEELLCDLRNDCPDGSDEDPRFCAAIENVTVYQKSSSAVYFRCQVHNRTAKWLTKLVGNYSTSDSKEIQCFDVLAEPCVFWPESYCFNIEGLQTNKRYNFSISAVLKDKSQGDPFLVSATTIEEASGPPEDVHVTSCLSTSAVLSWKHPNQSNGIIKSYTIYITEIETFDKTKCCIVFPTFDTPANEEEEVNVEVIGDLTPAATYVIGIAAKNMFISVFKTITLSTPPSPMDIIKQPNVVVSSLSPLTWKPMENPPTDLPQYHSLIKSYMLLAQPVRIEQQTNVINTEFDLLQPILESKIGPGFTVLWHKYIDDEEAFKQPIKIENLEHRKEYELIWVQVSQYKDAYGVDFIKSNHFIAI